MIKGLMSTELRDYIIISSLIYGIGNRAALDP